MMSGFNARRQHGSFKATASGSRGNNGVAEEKAFLTVLVNAACQSLRDALGADVLQVLESRGLLDNLDDPGEFDRQLRVFFGNGAGVVERLLVKELYRELGIRYNSESRFDYGESLEVAKEFCFVEARVK